MRVSCVLFVVAAMLACTGLLAANTTAVPSFTELPRMYVGNLSLDKKEYAVGSVVKGSFTLTNYSGNATGDLKCLMSLVGLDKTGRLARVIYDRKQLGPFEIAATSKKEIRFSYPLTFAPKDEDLAIHVRVIMSDGVSLSWALIPIRVTGGSVMVQPQGGYVEVNSKDRHYLQEGPTIQPTDKLTFNIVLKNPSAESLSVLPCVVLTDKAGEQVAGFKTQVGDPVSIGANGSAEVRLELPVEHLAPQTYIAKIHFEDGNHVICSPYFYARYIVGGDIVTVTKVLSSMKPPVEKGQKGAVSVTYTGKPIDISVAPAKAFKDATPVVADVQISLLDEHKEIISERSLKDQKFGLSGSVGTEMELLKPADKLLAKVTVSQGARVLCSYAGRVVFDNVGVTREAAKPQAPAKTASSRSASSVSVVAAIVGAIFALGIAIFLVGRYQKKRNCKKNV